MGLRTVPGMPETPQDKEERLIKEWKKARGFNKDQKLQELLKIFGGSIGMAVNQYRAAPLPFRTLELEAKRQAVIALKAYKPGMGAKPSSFIQTRVGQRLNRYVAEHQNVARLPEAQVHRIGSYNRAMDDLSGRFDREPTTHELADHMGIPVAHVTRLRKSLRSDLLSSKEGFDSFEDHSHDPDFNQAMMAYYNLSNQEKLVFDYLLGAHGQPRMQPKQIAQKLNITPARVSKVKKNIAKKLDPYLQR